MKPNLILNNLVLELHIPDFKKAKRFYSQFGFKELSFEAKTGNNGLSYLVLERKDKFGRTLINFYGNKKNVSKHARFVDFPINTPRGYAVEITIPTSDAEKL